MYEKYSEEVLQSIVDNIDIVEYIQNHIELHKEGKLYRALCPFHNEKDDSFTVYPETNSWSCFGCHRGGNIIHFVKEYYKIPFNKAVELLLNQTNIDISQIPKTSKVVQTLREYYNIKNKPKDKIEHIILPNNIMNKFTKANIKEWIQEGIDQEIMDLFDVRYDIKNNKIVFPIHDIEGNIINVKGRTLYPDWKKLGLKKYRYYYKLGQLDFLYGLYQNKSEIKKAKEIILVEGAKSVMKLMGFGFKNCCSLETDRISPEQIPLILSLKKDIVLVLDKGLTKQFIVEECKKLSHFTNVYYIFDEYNLLDDKDSPVDKGLGVFLKLYRNKKKVV